MSKELKKWMPMFWGDYFRGTQQFTNATEHGAYLLLIAYCWHNGGKLPMDDDVRRKIAKCSPRQWLLIRDLVSSKFDDEGRNERCNEELRYALVKSRRISAEARRKLGLIDASDDVREPLLTTPTPTPTKKERKKNPVAEPPEFSEFWASKPNREGGNPRWPAVLAYLKALGRGADPAQINAAAKRWRAESDKTEPRFIKTAVAWLNARMYEDYHIKPEAETNLEFDPVTKLWRYREGYEPTDEEREAHAKYRRSAIAARLP